MPSGRGRNAGNVLYTRESCHARRQLCTCELMLCDRALQPFSSMCLCTWILVAGMKASVCAGSALWHMSGQNESVLLSVQASEAPSTDDKFLPHGASNMSGSPKPPYTPSLEEAKARLPSPQTLVKTHGSDQPPWTPSLEEAKARLPSPQTLVQTRVSDQPPWTPSLEEAKARLPSPQALVQTHVSDQPPWTPSLEEAKARLPSPRTLVQTHVSDQPLWTSRSGRPLWTPSLEVTEARLRCMPPVLAELRQGLLPCMRPVHEPVASIPVSHKRTLARPMSRKIRSRIGLGSHMVSNHKGNSTYIMSARVPLAI